MTLSGVSPQACMTITEFLLARIAEDEAVARDLLADLEGEISEDWANQSDERGPMTPDRLLSAQMWAQYDGQSRRRSFARGQQIARLASPARVMAECAAKRAIVELHFECRWASVPSGCSVCRTLSSIPDTYPCRTVSHLAAVYDSHPDYSREWAL